METQGDSYSTVRKSPFDLAECTIQGPVSAEEQIFSLCITIFDKDEGGFGTFFSYLFNLLQPFFVGCKFCHKCLMLQPFAVQVPCLIIGHILGCKHLFIDPEWELERKMDTQVFRTFAVGNSAKYPNASGPRIQRCPLQKSCMRFRDCSYSGFS